MEHTSFDHERMLDFALHAIADFASAHADETFYGFSIDAALLCLNSEEQFVKSLAGYRERWPDYYQSEQDVRSLKLNTGDWAYQGFAELGEETGFDQQAYEDHYYAEYEEQKSTPYGLAMDRLVAALVERKAFAGLKRTPDFFANRVEHSY